MISTFYGLLAMIAFVGLLWAGSEIGEHVSRRRSKKRYEGKHREQVERLETWLFEEEQAITQEMQRQDREG